MTIQEKAKIALLQSGTTKFTMLITLLSSRTGLTCDQCRNELERIADGKESAA